jgi:hypothetical protein
VDFMHFHILEKKEYINFDGRTIDGLVTKQLFDLEVCMKSQHKTFLSNLQPKIQRKILCCDLVFRAICNPWEQGIMVFSWHSCIACNWTIFLSFPIFFLLQSFDILFHFGVLLSIFWKERNWFMFLLIFFFQKEKMN